MANTSRTISYDMMDLVIDLLQSVLIAPPRVGPIVRWPTTSKKDRSQYATASGYRSKHCRSVARSSNHNQSYDQAIVRSGVTVALVLRVRVRVTFWLMVWVSNLFGSNYNPNPSVTLTVIITQHLP